MTDDEIVALFWQRDENAIARTDACYGRYCRSIAWGILRNREDTEETVNDTYMKVWNRVPPDRPSPLKGYLARITRQLSINRLEKNTAQKRGGGEYTLALEELRECADDSDDLVERIVLTQVLDRFLRNLSGESRRIFLLRYWYCRSVGEIAREIGAGQSKVKMQLMRCREKLREELEKEGLL